MKFQNSVCYESWWFLACFAAFAEVMVCRGSSMPLSSLSKSFIFWAVYYNLLHLLHIASFKWKPYDFLQLVYKIYRLGCWHQTGSARWWTLFKKTFSSQHTEMRCAGFAKFNFSVHLEGFFYCSVAENHKQTHSHSLMFPLNCTKIHIKAKENIGIPDGTGAHQMGPASEILKV